jgi:hypothetical protein
MMDVVCGEGTDYSILHNKIMVRHGCSKLKVIHCDGAGRVVVGDETVINVGGKRLMPQQWLDSSIGKRDELNTTHSHSRGVAGADCRRGS